jgi:hypothetical protein
MRYNYYYYMSKSISKQKKDKKKKRSVLMKILKYRFDEFHQRTKNLMEIINTRALPFASRKTRVMNRAVYVNETKEEKESRIDRKDKAMGVFRTKVIIRSKKMEAEWAAKEKWEQEVLESDAWKRYIAQWEEDERKKSEKKRALEAAALEARLNNWFNRTFKIFQVEEERALYRKRNDEIAYKKWKKRKARIKKIKDYFGIKTIERDESYHYIDRYEDIR